MKYAWHCQFCDKPMFLTDFMPTAGHVIAAKDWTTMTGERVKDGDDIICPSCNTMQIYPTVLDVRPHADQP